MTAPRDHEPPQPEPEPTYGIVLVSSTEHALVAEQTLLAAGLKVRLIPVPRTISSECGMSVRFSWPDREQVERILRPALGRFEVRVLW
ncbi:MAG: DUF3343 domain-containing protein [Anaerolineae bacterium]